MLKYLLREVQRKGFGILNYFLIEMDWFILFFVVPSFNILIVSACLIITEADSIYVKLVSGIVITALLAALNMSILTNLTSLKTEAPTVESVGTDDKVVAGGKNVNEDEFVIPKYVIEHDDVAKMTSVRIDLPGCKKKWIKVAIWNKRQLHLLAYSQVNRFKLHYQFPCGARMFNNPSFAEKEGVLTCKFQSLDPVCKACGDAISRSPTMEIKEMFGILSDFETVPVMEADQLSKGQSFELVKPRFWVTYDDKMALFEAHLKGCKVSSRINFHIANHKVMILASLNDQRHYLLELFLESSAKCGWKTHFDPNMEMFICAIPLLGHYECDRCMAERHHQEEQDNSEANGPNAEKVVGVEEAEDPTG